MYKSESVKFIKIDKIVHELNNTLDQAMKLYEKGEIEGDVIDEVTDLIRRSYKEQLKILGYTGDVE